MVFNTCIILFAAGLKAKLENRAKRISTAVSPAPLADQKEKNSPPNQKVVGQQPYLALFSIRILSYIERFCLLGAVLGNSFLI
jgi:hypothetical protein